MDRLALALVLPLALPALTISGGLAPDLALSSAIDAYGEACSALEAEHVETLEGLADWCQKKKAYLQRDEVYGWILAFRPDHTDARRFLKYTKDHETGEWIRKWPYRTPRSGKDEVVKAFRERKRVIDEGLFDKRIMLVARHGKELGQVRREQELRSLLKDDPDHVKVRELLGYVRVEDAKGRTRWTTPLALEAEKRRGEITKVLAEAEESVPERVTLEPDRVDRQFDVEWEGLRGTPRVRVVTNTDEEEADEVARIVHLGWDVISTVVGAARKAPARYTVYLLDGENGKSAFIESCPGVTEAHRERAYDLGGIWVPRGARVAEWASRAVGRVDGALKQTTVYFLHHEFGITTKRGWLVEGVGLYVNQIVLETRYSRHVTFADGSQTEPRMDLDLEDPDADWLEIAADYLDECKPTRLAATFGRNTSEMTAEDVVLAYSFVAYLREGFGAEFFEKILRRVGAGEASSVVALEEAFGVKLPEIQRRFSRWLDEVGGDGF